MKGKYIKHRPQSTKAKGGNPSYFKPEHIASSPCINMKGEVIDSGGKYFAKDGTVRRKYAKRTSAHYVRRMPHQVVKKMNDEVVYATVSLLETKKGRQFWLAREEVTEWDAEQCLDIHVLSGESMSVTALEGAKECWLQVEDEDVVDTVEPTAGSAINRLSGVLS